MNAEEIAKQWVSSEKMAIWGVERRAVAVARALLTAIEALEDLRDAPEAHIGTVVAARKALRQIRGEEKGDET